MIQDNDWIRLCDMVSGEWIEHMVDVISMIGSTQKEGQRLAGEPENRVDVERLFKETSKWLGATTNSIDNEDGKIVERVGTHAVLGSTRLGASLYLVEIKLSEMTCCC